MRRGWSRSVVGLLLVFLGGYLFFRSQQVREHATALPRVSLETFARQGAGERRFVVLTDLRVDYEGAVFHRDMDAALAMYAPLHPAQSGNDEGDLAPVILEILDDRDRERLRDDSEPDSLTCQVDRSSDRIDPAFLAALERKHPGSSFAGARIATVGLHEPTTRQADALWWYGIVALMLAVSVPIVSAARLERRSRDWPRASLGSGS